MSALLRQLAREQLAQARRARFLEDRRRQEEEHQRKLSTALLDFIPKVTPRFVRPNHLSPVAELFERAEREPVRALVSLPPRHTKTETLLHGIAWRCLRHPDWTNCYASYSLPFATSKSRSARDYALAAGVEIRDDASSLIEWRMRDGGGLLTTSVGGPLTGHGLNLLVVDDPHKDRASAESAIDRDYVFDWFRGTAMTRIEPGGSVIVVHTRWHADDLIGRLSRDKDVVWEVINLPAIDDRGLALWPEKWPVQALEQRRLEVGEYDWASQYLGSPKPKGGSLFDADPTYYKKLPDEGYRYGIGIDMAYTEKKQSDYSCAVVCARKGGITYVVDVFREQALQHIFQTNLKARIVPKYPGAKILSYVSSTEKGITDIAKADGLNIHGKRAAADKYVRASPLAAQWNAGKVMLPEGAPWLDSFLSELKDFPKGRHDDQVDAFAAAFDVLDVPTQNSPPIHEWDFEGASVFSD